MGLIIFLVAIAPCFLGVVGFALRKSFGIKVYWGYWVSLSVVSLIVFTLTDDFEVAFIVTLLFASTLSISMKLLSIDSELIVAGLVSFVTSFFAWVAVGLALFSISGAGV